MKRISPYFDLRWRVDCQPPGQHFYQTIAAFNAESVATGYADDCSVYHKSAPGWQYRVMERKGNRWVQVWSDTEVPEKR